MQFYLNIHGSFVKNFKIAGIVFIIFDGDIKEICLFSFSNSTVYWAAGSWLFNISKNFSDWALFWNLAWLSSTMFSRFLVLCLGPMLLRWIFLQASEDNGAEISKERNIRLIRLPFWCTIRLLNLHRSTNPTDTF